MTSDDTVPVLDCLDENLSVVEPSISDNEIGNNLTAKVAYKTVNKVMGQVAPVASERHGVKW